MTPTLAGSSARTVLIILEQAGQLNPGICLRTVRMNLSTTAIRAGVGQKSMTDSKNLTRDLVLMKLKNSFRDHSVYCMQAISQ